MLLPNRAKQQELLSVHTDFAAKRGFLALRARRTRSSWQASTGQAGLNYCMDPIFQQVLPSGDIISHQALHTAHFPSLQSCCQDSYIAAAVWAGVATPISLLCPSFSSWTARQPGEARVRPLAQAPWLAACQGSQGQPSPPCLHTTVRQESIWFPPRNWEDTPDSVVGQSWFVFHDLERCQRREGPGCWDFSMLSEPVATAAGCGTSGA